MSTLLLTPISVMWNLYTTVCDVLKYQKMEDVLPMFQWCFCVSVMFQWCMFFWWLQEVPMELPRCSSAVLNVLNDSWWSLLSVACDYMLCLRCYSFRPKLIFQFQFCIQSLFDGVMYIFIIYILISVLIIKYY